MKKHHLTSTAARRIIFFLMFIGAYLLQFIVIPSTALGFPVMLLIPLGVSVSLYEKEFAGLFWGLLTGVLWDMASPHTDGLMALIFTVLFLFTGLLSRYILRNSLLTAALFTLLCSLIPTGISMLYSYRQLTRDAVISMLTGELLPAAAASLILSVPVYFAVRSVSNHFHRERS